MTRERTARFLRCCIFDSKFATVDKCQAGCCMCSEVVRVVPSTPDGASACDDGRQGVLLIKSRQRAPRTPPAPATTVAASCPLYARQTKAMQCTKRAGGSAQCNQTSWLNRNVSVVLMKRRSGVMVRCLKDRKTPPAYSRYALCSLTNVWAAAPRGGRVRNRRVRDRSLKRCSSEALASNEGGFNGAQPC